MDHLITYPNENQAPYLVREELKPPYFYLCQFVREGCETIQCLYITRERTNIKDIPYF